MFLRSLTLPWIGACALGELVIGPGSAPNTDLPGVQGDPSDMTLEPGEHEGFTLVACPDGDAFQILAEGPAVDLDPILVDVVLAFDSLVYWSGSGLGCVEGAPIWPVALYDWAEVDPLIEDVGRALVDAGVGGRVEVKVSGPIVAL